MDGETILTEKVSGNRQNTGNGGGVAGPSLQFKDNRSLAIEQKRLQDVISHSPMFRRAVQAKRLVRKRMKPAWPKTGQHAADLEHRTLLQRKVGFEFEMGDVQTLRLASGGNVPHGKGDVLSAQTGYNVTADINDGGSQLEFVTDQFDETNASDVDELESVAGRIESDVENIVDAASKNQKGWWAQASKVTGLGGGKAVDIFLPTRGKGYKTLAGQLQMTGGLDIYAMAGVLSGGAMPKREKDAQGGTVYQDYAFNYQAYSPSGGLQQPVFQAAIAAVNGFVSEVGKGKGLAGKVRGALAAVVTLMAEVPLNMYGELNMEGQGQFLARTDYSKILKLISDNARIHIDRNSFANALLSTINQVANRKFRLTDDVFPEEYKSAGQTLTGVTIGQWAKTVVPEPGKLWGRWQGTDLITQKHFPGTEAQKKELRAFGGFGNKTDPGNKVILEWRNFQMMNADHLRFVMKGLAGYVKGANKR